MQEPDEYELQSRFIPQPKAEDLSSSILSDKEALKERYCTFTFYIVLVL
jgi:hypothetical protein